MMKYFLPGIRVFPRYFEIGFTGMEESFVVLENKNGYLRRRWWGAIQFTKDFSLATKWSTVGEALNWAGKMNLC